MSDKPDKKAEAAPAAAAGADHGKKDGVKAAGGGLLSKTPVLLGGVMVLEAVVLFAGFKFLGSGAHAAAGADLAADHPTDVDETADAHGKPAADEHGDAPAGHGDAAAGHGDAAAGPKKAASAADKKKPVEIPVVEFKALNKKNGRTFLYDVSIVLVTRAEHADGVKSAMTERANLIKDKVRTIIAESDPEKLGGGSEPGLETLRRQVKFELDKIVGNGMVSEVLVPRCIPYRTDY